MDFIIQVPNIGTDAVEVTEILVNVGDNVIKEQSLVVVEGDKTSMEVPSPHAGVVKEITIKLGDKIQSGQNIMLFEAANNARAPTVLENEKGKESILPQSHDSKKIYAPKMNGDNITIISILAEVGNKIHVSDTIFWIGNQQNSIAIDTPFSGVVQEITVQNGDKIRTGMLLMVINIQHNILPSKSDIISGRYQTDDLLMPKSSYVHATPLVRRLARLFGVNLSIVPGTGIKSRVLQEDVQQYIQRAIQYTERAITNNSQPLDIPAWPKVNYSQFGEVKQIEISRLQKRSGANLKRNWSIIPHVTHFDKTDITDLEAFRKAQNHEAVKHHLDIKLTPLVFIMKAVAIALAKMPRFNSSISEDEQYLIVKKYIHIGIAVDTSDGLVVPVYKNVDKKGIIELSREIIKNSQKARDGRLTSSDMQGGCFTISSIGNLGTTYFSPIINAPEVAILGISKSVIEPVWNGKTFTPRILMPLSLSFDHRVIDGADGARFITIINKILSDIRQLVM
ncbi:2-oxo acid dehydrogenase subunit E2 [Candidatus Erwinia haradaeae]|uniref:Dihydrolipoamide acetyltransferase component of pyruvate dehydrogenase complex n=1 Tax=Candidatus Erwinia haradaeae TaxID=1922217 RepID=A0A451D9X7_9GAMM|nr:2-oxo acid dehydrogenase subunit E2 [Candidatus Erwinia haradaeae]VFP83076.1 Dihydrolipoyllysine-residue acetyltransferase component of pyruvate dehydrogenase complex [Candidatus Erwinia haradaeae]